MKCNIYSSDYFGKYCVKRKCTLYPCSQLKAAHRDRLGERVIIVHKNGGA